MHALAVRLTGRAIPTPTGQAIWSPSTIRGVLTNPAYRGEATSGRLRATRSRGRRSPLERVGRGVSTQAQARMAATSPAPRAATRCSAPTIAPTLSSSPCTAPRYHRIRSIGSRSSARSAAIRLTRPTPSRSRPLGTPSSAGLAGGGATRARHARFGQRRARYACSITRAGAAGTSNTSLRHATQPPPSDVAQRGHRAAACSTRSVGRARGRLNPCSRRFRGPSFRRRGVAAGFRPGIFVVGSSRSRCASSSRTRASSRPISACCSATVACNRSSSAAWRTTRSTSSACVSAPTTARSSAMPPVYPAAGLRR